MPPVRCHEQAKGSPEGFLTNKQTNNEEEEEESDFRKYACQTPPGVVSYMGRKKTFNSSYEIQSFLKSDS